MNIFLSVWILCVYGLCSAGQSPIYTLKKDLNLRKVTWYERPLENPGVANNMYTAFQIFQAERSNGQGINKNLILHL